MRHQTDPPPHLRIIEFFPRSMALCPMTLDELNRLSRTEAALAFSRCCGSSQWAKTMALKRPYQDEEELMSAADSVWKRLSEDDWLEAFACHPRIGEKNARDENPSPAWTWARAEQAGALAASQQVLDAFTARNAEYEKKFGYLFIVCATGRSGDEMMDLLRQRMRNDPRGEIQVAAEEQRKITGLRLKKLIGSQQP